MMPPRRLAAFAAIAFSILLSAGPLLAMEAQGDEVGDVLKHLEQRAAGLKTLSTDFIQEKRLAAFSEPVIIKGRIYIEKPSKLAWHVDEPLKYSVVITDKTVTQWDEDTDEAQEMPIAGNPVLRSSIEQMTAWFSGRYATLLKDYEVKITARSPLVLEFIPREGTMAGRVLKSITMGLQEDERYLSWIRIVEAGGDSTHIRFMNTVLDAPLKEGAFEAGRGA